MHDQGYFKHVFPVTPIFWENFLHLKYRENEGVKHWEIGFEEIYSPDWDIVD